MILPTPTRSGLPLRPGAFETLGEALDYAADGRSGLDFHSVRGELEASLPYRALRDGALLLARRLAGHGLNRGDRVGIVAETRPDFVRAFFACQYAGLVPAPLPLPMAFGGREAYVEHVRRLLEGASARALLFPAALEPMLAPLRLSLSLRVCGTVAALERDGAPDGVLPAPATAADIAYLQFSSGSTRFPVGIAVHQAALMANLRGILRHGLRIRDGDRAVSWLPFYHDMGLVGFLLAPLAGQIGVDLLATQDFARRPATWLQLISDKGGTVSYSPSFGYELCTRRSAAASPGLDLSRWRVAGIGGDMIRPGALEGFAAAFAPAGFPRTAFLPSYGMAEATLAISFAPAGDGAAFDVVDLDRLERDGIAAPFDAATGAPGRMREFASCGEPLPDHEIEVRDEEGGVLGERRAGRVFVRGPSLMRGYDDRPEETAAVLSADGWLDTGDLGYRLGRSLVITGRLKDLIIVNGRNVWPQDLEWSVEEAVDGVRAGTVAAFSLEEDGREVLVLAVETRLLPDAAEFAALRDAVADTIRARHGLDARVALLPPGALPFTSSGKLSRSAARQRFLSGTLKQPVPAAG
ncbi:MAG: fatty acyl-AMP ligase [Gluconacetobacter diazotrophicus]|nr:fatty acyl-AMP ligase [Gluconacetobacter diazotrophicus]